MSTSVRSKKKSTFAEEGGQTQRNLMVSQITPINQQFKPQKLFINPHQSFTSKTPKQHSFIHKQNLPLFNEKQFLKNLGGKQQSKEKKRNRSVILTKQMTPKNKQEKIKERTVSNFPPFLPPRPITKDKNTSFVPKKRNSFLPMSRSIDRNLNTISNTKRSDIFKKIIQRAPKLSDFVLSKCKGEGKFGKFYPAFHKATGFLFGIKVIKKQSISLMTQQFIRQIKLQYFCKHPNIVKIYSFFSDESCIYILLQYMEEGCLYNKMTEKNMLPEREVSTKMNEICSGIEYLHNLKIIHRDIKPENIVITHGVSKICDFGWAILSEDRRQTHCGTLDYICPEIAEGMSYDRGVDIWCLGVLVYEMLCGKTPFYNVSRKKTMENIVNRSVIPYPNHVTKLAIDFISRILYRDEKKQKIQIRDLLSHPFLSKTVK